MKKCPTVSWCHGIAGEDNEEIIETFGIDKAQLLSKDDYGMKYNTSLLISDTSERDSLFQAESRRCKEIIDNITSTNQEQTRHFGIFDELYSGTNPYEAISAATGYLKFLDKNKNVTFILTTHYLDLCKILQVESNVKNLQMQVDVNNKDFIYTYKIIEGISNIKGGIKVLNDLKYPDDILDECNKLLKVCIYSSFVCKPYSSENCN